MRGGKRVLSPAVSSFFGVTNGVLHPPQSSSTSSPTFSLRLFQFCRARAPRSEVVVWRRGRVNQLLPRSQGKTVGERDIVLESKSPLGPTAVCQRGI